MRARMALLVSETQCAVREIKLSNKPDAMLLASPKGTVPVLVLSDGSVIDESIDIMVWALQRNDPQHWLSDDTAERARLIAQNDGAFKFHLDRYKYPAKFESDAPEHRDAAEAILHHYETRLAQAPYLSGQQVGFIDYALLPFIRQFAHVDRGYFYALPLPCLHNWLRGHLESALFVRGMVHFPVWAQGDDAVYLMGAD